MGRELAHFLRSGRCIDLVCFLNNDDDLVHLGTIDGDECFDPVGVPTLREEVAYAAQVAKALLADVPDDKDIVASAYLCGVHRAKEGQQYREAASVVPDTGCIKYCALAPHGDVGAFGEDRIEMRRHYD